MNILLIIQFIAIFISFCIVVIYGLSTYWFFKSCRVINDPGETRLFRYLSIASLILTMVYTFLFLELSLRTFFNIGFIERLSEDFTDISLFGTVFVKPAVLLLGGAIASVARARYTALYNGGNIWISKTPKN